MVQNKPKPFLFLTQRAPPAHEEIYNIYQAPLNSPSILDSLTGHWGFPFARFLACVLSKGDPTTLFV